MNKKDIDKFGQEINCYRIKTKRKKIREVRKANEKKLIRLDKEWGQIGNQQRSMGYVDLHPPVMKGWKRYFVLREDVAKSKHAGFYRGILEKINTTIYSNRKDFQKRKHRRSRKKLVDIQQSLLSPDEWQIRKLKFSEKELLLFEERWVKRDWTHQRIKIFVFKEPWRFVLRIRPNLITKIKAVSITLEIREKEIRDYLEQNNKMGTLRRLKGDSNCWGRNLFPKKQYRFKKTTLREMLSENKNEAFFY